MFVKNEKEAKNRTDTFSATDFNFIRFDSRCSILLRPVFYWTVLVSSAIIVIRLPSNGCFTPSKTIRNSDLIAHVSGVSCHSTVFHIVCVCVRVVYTYGGEKCHEMKMYCRIYETQYNSNDCCTSAFISDKIEQPRHTSNYCLNSFK